MQNSKFKNIWQSQILLCRTIQNSKLLLLLVIILAAGLRLFALGSNPPSLDWDEASLGYNAYSLLKTGKDEFGRSWPISIRSFEDYKPAVYTYLTIPAIAVFGLNEFAVRLPSAVFGLFTVGVTYLLAGELVAGWNKSNKTYTTDKNNRIALVVAFLLAISPWHLQFSRVAFEANVALFFVTSGIYLFLKGLKNGPWLLFSGISFVISFYTYHSPRLVVPLLLLGWAIWYRGNIWEKRKWVVVSVLCAGVLLIPFVKETMTVGRARFGSVTVIAPDGRLEDSIKRIEYDQAKNDWLGKLLHNRRIVYGLAVVKGYLDHFNLDFLFLTGDAPDRHHARDMGMLYLWEAPFVMLGILFLLRQKQGAPLFWWFLVAPAASAITTGTPHAVRALLYLPTYQVFTAVGLIGLIKHIGRIGGESKTKIAVGLVFLLTAVGVNVSYYLEMYYVHTPIEAAKDWQYGYKQAVAEMKKYEEVVDKIIVTYRYDQPHVYVLFYEQVDPVWYQKQWQGGEIRRDVRAFGKYEFRNIEWDQDQHLENVLLVGTPGEIPDGTMRQVADIHFPDGSVAFRIVRR